MAPEETTASKTGAGRIALHVLFVVVEVAAFVWLLNLLVPATPWFLASVAGSLSHGTWTLVTLTAAGFAILLQVLLLVLAPSGAGAGTAAWAALPAGALLELGCSACGATFTIPGSDADKTFSCPSCGKPGRITAKAR